MGEIKSIPAPSRLEAPGRKLWKAISKAYVLRPDELIVLENACRSLDLIENLDAAMEGQPLVVKGSMGQEREHPLLSEQRQQRAILNRCLAQLKLPEEGEMAGAENSRSVAARKAAMKRWSTPARVDVDAYRESLA